MVKPSKKTTKAEKPEEPKKLSKLGIAMRDKTLPSIGYIVDMKAVLK
ncbi:hypothetical protein [Leadbetterella sp. DM7]